jgi:hypothetical protein
MQASDKLEQGSHALSKRLYEHAVPQPHASEKPKHGERMIDAEFKMKE